MSNEGTGGIIWVCENGCIDVAHRTEGNYTDRCSVCKEGTSEPHATLGRRSKEQRDRDRELAEMFPRFAESLKRPRRVPAPPVPSEVTVSRPGRSKVVVPADDFKHQAPVASFELTPDQRAAVLDPNRKAPRLAFPRSAPSGHSKGQPWPASKGDVVQISKHVKIVVLGLRHLVNEIEIQYEIRDDRLDLPDAPKTFKPLDPKVPPTTLYRPERGESEPAPVSRREASQLADQVHEAELRRLRRVRDQHGATLAELADQPRDVRWTIRKTLETLDARIVEVEHQLQGSQHRREIERRRRAAAA